VIVLREQIHIWHILVLVALAGYMILNYGFSNITFHFNGIPIIFGHALMFGALAIIIIFRHDTITRGLSEPAVICFIFMQSITIIHLVYDIPQYGFIAIRDSSLFLEGIFLFIGLHLSRNRQQIDIFLKSLFFIFLMSFLYSLSFPWRESVLASSPQSGILHPVPVVGYYRSTALFLLSGAFFNLWLSQYFSKWPRWVISIIVLAQLFAVVVFQVRSMYVGAILVFIIILILGKTRKWFSIATLVIILVSLLISISVFTRIIIPGYRAPTSISFLAQYAQSLLLIPGTPRVETINNRIDRYKKVWERIISDRVNFMIGEGFGRPIVEQFDSEHMVIIRHPHNSHLSVFARLGLAGILLWLTFHLLIVQRFLRYLLLPSRMDPKKRSIVLWLFVFYSLSLLITSVQGFLETSHGAIPFYVLTGFALGFMRYQIGEKESEIKKRTNRLHS